MTHAEGKKAPTAMARRVRQLREARGMSQMTLAVAAGVSMSVVTQLEQGYKADLRVSTAVALARALGVTVDELLREDEDVVPPAPKAKRGRPHKAN